MAGAGAGAVAISRLREADTGDADAREDGTRAAVAVPTMNDAAAVTVAIVANASFMTSNLPSVRNARATRPVGA